MAIRRGTTPVLTIIAEDIDLRGKTVYVTLAQSRYMLTKKSGDEAMTIESDGTDSTIQLILSQAETLQFVSGTTQVQIRWIDEDGTAHGSDIKTIMLNRIILEGAITYEE